jgi:hypothetical protein
MRICKLIAAVSLLMLTAACAVYTTDYPYHSYHAYHYGPPPVMYYG